MCRVAFVWRSGVCVGAVCIQRCSVCGWMVGTCGKGEWHIGVQCKFICVCMCARVLIGAREDIRHPAPPSSSSPHPDSLSQNLELGCQPVVSPKNPLISASYSRGVPGVPRPAQRFIQMLGSKLRSSRLPKKSSFVSTGPALFNFSPPVLE